MEGHLQTLSLAQRRRIDTGRQYVAAWRAFGGMVVSAVIILGALLLTAMVLMRGDLYPSSPVQALNIAQHALM
jgi:hypothetical protein